MSDSATVSTSKLEDSPALEIFGIMIIIIIMLLFILVLLVIIFRLHTVRHHFWNHHTTRQPTSSDLPTLQQRRGLDPSILKSIKMVQFSAAEDQLGLKCSVCLCQVSEGEKARYLPGCNHGFHMQCIDIWFHSHSTCPLCRNIVTISADDLEAAAVDTGVSPNSPPPLLRVQRRICGGSRGVLDPPEIQNLQVCMEQCCMVRGTVHGSVNWIPHTGTRVDFDPDRYGSRTNSPFPANPN